MAGLEELAQYLAMQQGAKQAIAAENPYREPSGIFLDLGGQAAKASGYGTGERVANSLVSGLLGGILGGLGNNYQGRAEDAYMSTVANAARGNLIEQPSELSDSIFSQARNQGSMFNLMKNLRAEEAKTSLENEIEKAKALEGVKAGTAREQAFFDAFLKNPKQAMRAAEQFGAVQQAMKEGRPIAATPEDSTTVSKPGASKPKSYIEKLQELSMKFQEENGATPNAAFDAAAQALAPDRNEMTAAQKRVDSLREKASALELVADTAEAGVKGAGKTGGFGGGIRDAASSIWALFSSDEANQRASQALLDSVSPDIIKASRDAGVGAMAESEMKQYLGAGPNSAKTPKTNELLIEKTRNVAKISREYADFIDTYRNEQGTLQGADALWQEYKKANPLFIEQKGELVYNSNRPSWREFLGATATEPTAPQPGGASGSWGDSASSGASYEIRTAPNGQRYKVIVGQ